MIFEEAPNQIKWKPGNPIYTIWRRNTATGEGIYWRQTDSQMKALYWYSLIENNPNLEARMFDKGILL
jgi:hypothetical protein